MGFRTPLSWSAAQEMLIEAATNSLPDDQSDLLELFVSLARASGLADSAELYLPSLNGQWICEVADPPSNIGGPFKSGQEALQHLRSGDTYEDGSSLCAPLFVEGKLDGCLRVRRGPDQRHFTDGDRTAAGTFAGLGALLLELTSAREAQSRTTLLEERERISRDLHDLAIQDLFAVGIMLQTLLVDTENGLPPMATGRRLKEVMTKLEATISQIREIVYDLKTTDSQATFTEALVSEASSARTHLGFAPTVMLAMDGHELTKMSGEEAATVSRRVNPRLADDVIAVLREALTNVAKHAGAHSVQVHVNIHGHGPSGEIEMVIVDDGAGVDPSITRSSGLSNIAGRAATHGGTFAVSSGPRGRGTSLAWRAPLN